MESDNLWDLHERAIESCDARLQSYIDRLATCSQYSKDKITRQIQCEQYKLALIKAKSIDTCTVGDMIDKVFSHNEIITLWEERRNELGSLKYRIYKGMAHALPQEHKERIFVRVFGTLVENVTDSDVINILVTPKITPRYNVDLEKSMQEGNEMNAKRAAKLLKIAHYYGEEKQVCKLIEELGEATSAASELLMRMTFREDAGKGKDIQARLEHLAAELADVQNVTEQVITLFGLELDFKAARQAGIDKTLKRICDAEGGEPDGPDGAA